ncbi:MAG TPA: choice-of-anchor D domain-containing protein [Thermoanaerobaculia bacterium]|nr:choice-of-anchor D domain-containing protein [Thermoanaerobaculia bacterium]
MKTTRILLLSLFVFAAASVFAQPDIAVSRAWDSVAVPNGGAFAFPPTGTNIPDSRQFRISNTGPGLLEISNASTIVSGACFHLIETPASSVISGQSTTFRVRVLCATPGFYNGTISISSNDPDENPYVISLSAEVRGPDIAVYRSGIFQADGSSYTFPDGHFSPQSTVFEIKNTSLGDLNISSISVTGQGFTLIEAPASVVPGGTSTFFRVRFYTLQVGTFYGAITINSNDPDESPYDIALVGRQALD